jgi:hypothetical protein
MGICAIDVNYVPDESVETLSKELMNIFGIGAGTFGVINNADYTSRIRIIIAADSNIKSISTGLGVDNSK